MRRMFEPLEHLSSIFQNFWIKYAKIYIKFPFIWCILLFCSLVFIRATWENVKIYTFYFFQICRKKLQEIAKLQYINFRGSKASIIQFWNLFIKYIKFSFIWCIFLICSFIFISITRKNIRYHLFQYVYFLKNLHHVLQYKSSMILRLEAVSL